MSSKEFYDAIIVGAGSVGTPTALALAERGLKPLVVESLKSIGSRGNKAAIGKSKMTVPDLIVMCPGGIRATHGSKSKIVACLESLHVFRTWKDRFGDDIEWMPGGYLFPAYRKKEEDILRSLLPVQKSSGMEIDFVSPAKVKQLVPGIVEKGLLGGTYSPEDGTVSPLLAINAMKRVAEEEGAKFYVGTHVRKVRFVSDRQTGKKRFDGLELSSGKSVHAPVLVEATGALSRVFCTNHLGYDLPITNDGHEAGITEPISRFFDPLIVDIRSEKGSKNVYFYQNRHGQIVFCLTPDPLEIGDSVDETARFLPLVSRRLIALIPKLREIRVRRVWRGLYPMTRDGEPLVGKSNKIEGVYHATGMCGQGLMLGPGIGGLLARCILRDRGSRLPDLRACESADSLLLSAFAPFRAFSRQSEALK